MQLKSLQLPFEGAVEEGVEEGVQAGFALGLDGFHLADFGYTLSEFFLRGYRRKINHELF